MIEVLCIGGKHDGRWVTTSDNEPCVRLSDKPLLLTSFIPDEKIESVAFTYSIYEIKRVRMNNTDYWFGVPPGQSEDVTFNMLVLGYRGF